jgi:hypothetical protein
MSIKDHLLTPPKKSLFSQLLKLSHWLPAVPRIHQVIKTKKLLRSVHDTPSSRARAMETKASASGSCCLPWHERLRAGFPGELSQQADTVHL